jgi:hypothetical protein
VVSLYTGIGFFDPPVDPAHHPRNASPSLFLGVVGIMECKLKPLSYRP